MGHLGGTLIQVRFGGGTFGWDINSGESWRWDILGGTLIGDINSRRWDICGHFRFEGGGV